MSDDPDLAGAVRRAAVPGGTGALTDLQAWPGAGPPWAQLGMAVVWMVLPGIGALLLVLAGGLLLVWTGLLRWTDVVAGDELAGLPLQQGLLALAAVRRAWRVGGGDLRAGLGWRVVRRRRLVMALLGCTVLLVAVQSGLSEALPGLREFYREAVPTLDMPMLGDAWYALWIIGTVVIGAPLAEELFFRGCLWEGLRQRWGAWRTGAATGLLFLLVHGLGGQWRQLVVLVPGVVLLSVAREVGGSVRASLAVHMLNNGMGAAALIAARLTGG